MIKKHEKVEEKGLSLVTCQKRQHFRAGSSLAEKLTDFNCYHLVEFTLVYMKVSVWHAASGGCGSGKAPKYFPHKNC